MSHPLQNRLYELGQEKIFNRSEIIVHIGSAPKHLLFIKTGLIESFYHLNGVRVVSEFRASNEVLLEVANLHGEEPTSNGVSAVQHTILSVLSYTDLRAIVDELPEFEFHINKLIEKKVSDCERRSMILSAKTDLRLEYFLEQFKDHLSNIPRKHISQYLCISEAHLYELLKRRRQLEKGARKFGNR